MKKSLSILVAVAMMITMFAGVAFAAEKTNKELLGAAGIIQGGTGGASLDNSSWKREDVVVLLTRLYGQTEQDMKSHAKTHNFKDISNTYYDGFISWAVGEELVNGRSDTVFGFGDLITAQEFATLLLRVIEVDFEFKDAIDKALQLGIMTKRLPDKSEVSRNASYDGIVNTLNTKNSEGVTLGAKLGLQGWQEVSELPVKPPVDPPVTENGGDDIVELTIIEEILNGVFMSTSEEIAEFYQEELGIESRINADRSVTLVMSKEMQEAIVKDKKDSFRMWMSETVNQIESVKSMTINDTFRELRITVDQALYEERADGMQLAFIPFLHILDIQIHDLVPLPDIYYQMVFINEKTGEVFDTSEFQNDY